MSNTAIDEKTANKVIADLIDYGIFKQRFKGKDRIPEIAFETGFLRHLHRYCKDPSKDKLTLWKRFEIIKSYNQRTESIRFDDVPNLWTAIQAMHNLL